MRKVVSSTSPLTFMRYKASLKDLGRKVKKVVSLTPTLTKTNNNICREKKKKKHTLPIIERYKKL